MIELTRRTPGVMIEPDGDLEDETLHDATTVETLPPDVIAIERWLTEGGRVLPDEFDQ